MNVNEVIANRAIQLVGGELGSKRPVHPNDDVNSGQSSNDTFPTAMHIAARAWRWPRACCPACGRLREAARRKSEEWADVVKIGRTHLQDATPLTVGQEWSGYVAQLDDAAEAITAALPGLRQLAIGGTAVGTGLNAPAGFGDGSGGRDLPRSPGTQFVTAPNKFAAQASLDGAGPRLGGAARAERRAVQVRQRHALARLRPAQRAGRADPAAERAGVLDHAGQGQPDPGRGDADGLPAGDGQRHRGRRWQAPKATSSSTRSARWRSATSCIRPASWPMPATSFRAFLVEGALLNEARLSRGRRALGDDGDRAQPGDRLRRGRGHRPSRGGART